MGLFSQLGQITPEGLEKALRRVVAIISIVTMVLQFILRLAEKGNE